MLQDCNKVHIPSFNETCCLTHLIEMNDFSNDHFLSSKYTKFFFKEILSLYKSNKLDYPSYNKDITNKLIKILIHQLCHFFSLTKFRFAKLMVNIALDIHNRSIFKSNPDIVAGTAAVYNNVACIYERTGQSEKALKYFNHYSKYITNPIDKLIYYNNSLKVMIKIKRVNEIDDMIDKFKSTLYQEIDKAKNEKLIALAKKDVIDDNEFTNRCKLLTFLLYNLAIAVESQNVKEAKENYKKGYEFAISMLGESNFYTNKFLHKIDAKRPVSFNKAKTMLTEPQRSKTPNKRTNNSKLSRKETVNVEINQKMDKIIEQLDFVSSKFHNASSSSEMNKSQSSEININPKIGNQCYTMKEMPAMRTTESLSVSKMKEMMKHKINPIFDMINTKDRAQTKEFTKSMIDEAIKEFEAEEMITKSKSMAQAPIKVNNFTKKEEKKEEPQFKKPPRIKQLFQKVIGIKKEPPKGKFSSMITSMINDKDTQSEEKKQIDVNLNVKDNDELVFDSARKEPMMFDIDLDKDDVTYPSKPQMKIKEKLSSSLSLKQFESLLSSPISKEISFKINRRFSDIDFVIELTINSTTFSFSLSHKENKLYSLNLEFKKIKSTLSKMSLIYGAKSTETLLAFNTIDKFALLFSKFISILKSSSSSRKFKFGISPTPIGVVIDKRIEFKISKYSCVIDVIKNNNEYRALITSLLNQQHFCVNVHTKKEISNMEQFALKITSKLQDALKPKKDLDFNNENIVYNLLIDEDDKIRFIVTEIINDKITVSLVDGINNFRINIDDHIVYKMFGIVTKTISQFLIKEEKNTLLNILSSFIISDELCERIRISSCIIDIDITKDNAKFIYRMCQVRNAESVSHYLLRIFSKEEKKEIVKVYLKSSDVDMDDVVDNIESKLQSIYDEKEFSMIGAIENL